VNRRDVIADVLHDYHYSESADAVADQLLIDLAAQINAALSPDPDAIVARLEADGWFVHTPVAAVGIRGDEVIVKGGQTRAAALTALEAEVRDA
jgi:hypothetical protein